MTSTTWTRNTANSSVPHLTDEDFGSFRGGRSYYYNRRDARGRFVRAVDIAQVRTEDLPMWNAGRLGHAVRSCAMASGEAVEVRHGDADFFCATCVHVFVPEAFEATHACGKSGHMTCDRCDETKPVTKFPTVHTRGTGSTHRASVCRACRDEMAKPRPKAPAPWQRQTWGA